MRSANIEDVMNAHSFTPPRNVMFDVYHPEFGHLRAHIKGIDFDAQGCADGLFVETALGTPLRIEYSWLRPIPRKQGSVPKQKKLHVRGTKPYLSNCVPYDPKLIKVGTRVKCRDKKIRTVEYVTTNGIVHFTDPDVSCVDLDTGFANYTRRNPWHSDIMKIMINVPIEKKKDKYNGYEVGKWYFWEGKTDVPPVDGDVKIAVWVREFNSDQLAFDNLLFAKDCQWGWDGDWEDADIIAFQIVKD